MSFLLGIDKGTSVVKAVVFDADGTARGSAARRVPVLHPRAGWHEEDPEATFEATAAVIREAIAAAGVAGEAIAGVGIAGHMGGAWIVDRDDRPVRNAVCWPDGRAQEMQVALQASGRMARVVEIGGNGLMPGITAMVLGWLSRHEPETLASASHVLLAKDYLRLRLTGEIATDPSDVTFVPGDVEAQRFSAEILDLCGAGAWADRLPPVLPSDAAAGRVTAEAARLTGLRAGTPVVTGLGDASANAVGSGALTPGRAVTVLGTSCLNSLVIDRPAREPAGLGFLFAMPEGRYLRILPNTSGTIAFDWYLDRFGGPTLPDGGSDFAAIEALAAGAPIGAGGVVFLPFVNSSGVLAPVFDTLARGSWFGVSTHTGEAHLLRALYEALCFATRDCFEAMPVRPEVLMLTGGGARSAFWAQMFADVTGLAIEVPDVAESGALGVALLAGTACGLWPDLAAASRATARIAARYEPDPDAAALYDGWFGLYRSLRETYLAVSEERTALAGMDEGMAA